MKRFLVFIPVFTLISCAGSYYKKSETIEEKINRYEAYNINQLTIPKLPVVSRDSVAVFETPKDKRGRAPASVKKKTAPARIEQSDKRLYFLTLLDQYKELGRYGKKEYPEIKICPKFHSTIVDEAEHLNRGEYRKDLNIGYNEKLRKIDYYLNPELALTHSKDGEGPNVAKLIRYDGMNEAVAVSKALDVHMEKLHGELVVLCETGSSDHHAIFHNLMTYIERGEIRVANDPKIYQLLMKSPIFFNQRLIKSFENKEKRSGRMPASATKKLGERSYFKEILFRSKGEVVSPFFY